MMLDNPVLVLNKYYMAIDVATVRRAIVMLYMDHAEVILVSGGRYETFDFDQWKAMSAMSPGKDGIKAVSFVINAPQVIRLTVCDRLPKRRVPLTRKNILVRDGYMCQYCGRKLPPSRLSLDHVLPLSRGGRQSWTNVVCACFECNGRKGGHMPREVGMKLKKAPRTPDFTQAIEARLPGDLSHIWKRFF